MFTSLIRNLSDLLPSSCHVCGAWGRQAVCGDCVGSFAKPQLRCSTCALPLRDISHGLSHDTNAQQTMRCGACLSMGSALDSCHAAVDYAYPWDKLLKRFKYSDGGDLRAQPALAKSLAHVMRQVAQQEGAFAKALQEASRSDWIIPVPLHSQRQRERGFNQADALAKALFADHARLRNDLLLRIAHTAVQASLPRDARAHNLRGAFIAAPLQAHHLQGARITLVDDVSTTASTLSAAALALRQAGVHEIHALVFARTS
jgi:ComF family protein